MRERPSRFYYGWVIVAVSFAAIFMALGTRFSFGVFYVAILDEYHWGRGETAGAFSLAMVIHGIFAPISGTLIDRLGPRKFFPAGAVFLTLGLFAASKITAIWHLYLFFGVLIAIGVNTLSFTPHMSIIPTWFVKKRGLASGLVLAGIGLGTMILAPAVQVIINTADWRYAFAVLAAVMLFLIVPATAIFHRGSPAEMGQYPDGITPRKDPDLSDRKGVNDHDTALAESGEEWSLPMAFRDRAFWYMGLATFTNGFMANILVVHQAAHLVDCGYSPVLAASSVGMVGLLGSVGGIVGGSFSDRFGREIGFTVGGAAAFVGVANLLLIRDSSSILILYVFVILYGLGYGIMQPVLAAKTGDFFPGKSLGKIFGILSTCYGFGGALGAYEGGYFYDMTGSYSIPFVLLLMSICLGVTGVWLASRSR